MNADEKVSKRKILGPDDEFYTPWQIDGNRGTHQKQESKNRCSRDVFMDWGQCNRADVRCEDCPHGEN